MSCVRSGPGTAPSGLAEIARASTRLDVRSDPADELIAATSVVHKVPLVTRDRAPRRSRLIPHARRAGG